MRSKKMQTFVISDLQRKDMPNDIDSRCRSFVTGRRSLECSKPSEAGTSMTVEDVVSSFLNLVRSLEWLLNKIKFLKLQAEAICLHVPNSHRLRFICIFSLGSLKELLICKAESIACLKPQIEMEPRRQKFLEDYLNDSAYHLNGHKSLKDLTGVVVVATEWMHLLESIIAGMIISHLRISSLKNCYSQSIVGMAGFGNTTLYVDLARLVKKIFMG